ncbi:MAG: GvpL/GvpF family gas vesicle protein [Desulfobacteraceae bacterium]|nr:GvpL/GvpF family gas vesicle protein [Desulfobacteraceae bacterium]
MTDEGRTIYGFIQGDEPRRFGAIGIDGREVYTLSFEDISALVSRLPREGFAALPKETLLRNLTVYQSVIEQVMNEHPVIPVKFGSLLEGDEAVIHILKRGKEPIVQSLKEMESRIELDVAAFWPDLNPVLAEIGQTEEIKALKEDAAAKSEEDVLGMQIKAGKRVKTLLDQKRESLQSEIMAPLLEIAEKHCIHSLMDDSMIMNTAFLVQRENAPRLEEIVQGLDRRYEDRINFRIIGPLPAYSFRTFEIKTADYVQLNNARKILQLKEEATQVEIRDNYWQLTKKFHPDKFPGDRKAQKHFEKINQAYKLVNDYCDGPSRSFRETDVKGWASITPVEK